MSDKTDLVRWARRHRVDPENTPRDGVHRFGPFVVIEQFPPGTRRLNRRGTDVKKALPKVRRLRYPLPGLAGHRQDDGRETT